MNNKHPSVFSAGHFHAPKIHRPTKKKEKKESIFILLPILNSNMTNKTTTEILFYFKYFSASHIISSIKFQFDGNGDRVGNGGVSIASMLAEFLHCFWHSSTVQ